MITKEVINKICHKSISTGELITEDLFRYGLTNEDIEKLLENKTITLIQPNKYEISSFEAIYSYGVGKINEGEIYQGVECFERCYKINPKHKENNLQLLIFLISKKRWETVYRILDSLYDIEEPGLENEVNLYLYLISYITEVPERYKEKLENITKEDLILPSELIYNEIIDKILIGKYILAIKQINQLCKYGISLTNKIIKMLLSKLIVCEQEISKEILQLCKEERYHDIDVILSKRNNNRANQYILILTKVIKDILKNKTIPTITNVNTNDMFEAIDCNDFELALKINQEYLERYNLNKDNTINNLLLKINELILSIKKQNNISLEKTSKETTEESETTVETSKSNETNTNVPELILELLQNNIDKFSELLKNYLKQTGKEEYAYLIEKLIKLCLLEKDNTFIKPITILTELSNNNYNFDISSYLQTFYLYLSQNKLSESRIILEIICRYYHNSQIVIDNLNSALEQKEKQVELENNERNFTKQETESIQPPRNPKIEEVREMLTRTLYEMKQNEENLTILTSIPYETRIIIHSLINEIEGLKVSSIGKEPKTMILRITKKHQEEIIYKEVIDELYLANSEKRYNRCLEIANILLQDDNFNPLEQEKPKKLFDTIGHIYLMLANHNEAIKYLTIVTEMNKQKNDYKKQYDYSLLIPTLTKLNKSISLETQSNQTPTTTKLRSHTIEMFQLKDLEKLVHNIDENILTLKEAIDKFNLTDEQILLMKLIRARNFYIDKIPKMGDKLLKEVERSTNKTLQVIYFLDEIKNNKKLYGNQYERYTKTKK